MRSLPQVQAFLRRHTNGTAAPPRIAVFDCDGTVVRGDIGESMLYDQIRRFLFRRSPADIWTDHPARDALGDLFDALERAHPEERTTRPEFTRFADLMLDRYFGQINDGQVVKSCGDIVRLYAGFTTAEVRRFARQNFDAHLRTAFGTRALGRRSVPEGIRYLRESVDLLSAVREHGFDVWAISGSSQWSVEPVFEDLGVGPARVIGIDLETEGGVLSDRVILPIPIREGKVEAMHARGLDAPVLVASDSRNDIPLFLSCTDLKVRINSRGRDTAEFFRSASIHPDDRWVLIETLSTIPGPEDSGG